MSNINKVSKAHEHEINWKDIIDHSQWQSMPKEWTAQSDINPSQEIATGNDVLLFRTHAYHTNPDLRDKEGDGIVHASCAPIIPTSIKRYNAQDTYAAPMNVTFISVYRAKSGQAFYMDEGLEYDSPKGDVGTPIESITKFDPSTSGHFETDASDCACIGLYMMTLQLDMSARRNPKSVLTQEIKTLRIDDKPGILATLQKNL